MESPLKGRADILSGAEEAEILAAAFPIFGTRKLASLVAVHDRLHAGGFTAALISCAWCMVPAVAIVTALSAMLVHPNFDPIAFSIGPLAVRWYGLMYLIGFTLFFLLGRYRARHDAWRGISHTLIDDLLFWGVLGVVLGGRLGYVLFYRPGHYLSHPAEILSVWQGGMSFHGGLLGVLLAIWLVGRKHRLSFLAVADFVAPLIPTGLAAGRLGNFINAELWGRPSDVPWAMVFPAAGPMPRHPSQLYQFALEGVLLFVILWVYSARPRPTGAVSGAFLVGYGCLRFIAEYFRQPDEFLGLLALNMSMGQWLSLPLVMAGVALLLWAYGRSSKTVQKRT